MIYTVCIMSYAAFSHGKSGAQRIGVGAALLGVACFITVCTLSRLYLIASNGITDSMSPYARFTTFTPRTLCSIRWHMVL